MTTFLTGLGAVDQPITFGVDETVSGGNTGFPWGTLLSTVTDVAKAVRPSIVGAMSPEARSAASRFFPMFMPPVQPTLVPIAPPQRPFVERAVPWVAGGIGLVVLAKLFGGRGRRR